jgi:transcriptional regulator with XRE-family HTH domain
MSQRIRGKAKRRLTKLRAWREHRKLSLDKAADRFVKMGADSLSGAQLSRIETGKSPYTQDFLELAEKVYETDIVSLLYRDPKRADATVEAITKLLTGT